MRATLACLAAVLLLAGVMNVGSAATPGAQEISRQSLPCGPSVAIGCQDDTEQEPDIAINPVDPTNVVAVVQEGRLYTGASQGIAYATTTDGGAMWTGGTLPDLTTGTLPRIGVHGSPWDRASDPVVAFDRKHGVVLAESLVESGARTLAVPTSVGSMLPVVHAPTGVVVNRSTDGGRTFGQPVTIDDDPDVLHDKNWITVDNSPASPYYGREYAAWDTDVVQEGGFAFSDDGGMTWTSSPLHPELYPIILVGPTGRVDIVSRHLPTLISDDGGMHWRTGGVPDQSLSLPPETLAGGLRDPSMLSASIDAATGEIVAAIAAPDGSKVPGDIAVMTSSDGGQTWSSPVFATAGDSSLYAHFTPAVAIEHGRVYLTYRRRLLGPAVLADTVMQISDDGGKSFGSPKTLGPPSVTAFSPVTDGEQFPAFFFGDYLGLAVQGGHWYAAWAQSGPYADGTPGRTHQRLYAATGSAP